MIGRMAIARPWIFATWDQSMNVNLAEIWRKMYCYIVEDFPPAVALRRVQMFTKYFAANFVFGHRFFHHIANAPSLAEARARADDFFSRGPATVMQPVMAGL